VFIVKYFYSLQPVSSADICCNQVCSELSPPVYRLCRSYT